MDWAVEWMESLGYLGIFLIVLIENLFPPIPSEFVLPFGGFMTTESALTVPGVIASATAGSVVGALALYGVGATIGRERIYRIVTRYGRWLTVRPEHVQKAESWYEKYGVRTVLFCRVMPIVRSIISIPAGLVRMQLPKFIVYTALGALVWNSVLVGLGALLGSSWRVILTWMEYYKLAFVIAGVVAAIVIAVVLLMRKRAK